MRRQKLTYVIRKAQLDDLEDILTIYNQAIKTKTATADTEPQSINDRIDWFHEHTQDKYPIYVAENDGDVIGWISISPYRCGRKALSATAEISYYVHADYSGMGIGSALIQYVLNKCSKLGLENLFAIILDKNINSINLMKKFNFQQWAFMPNIADFDGEKCGQVYYGINL
ncbi:MAG: N-acetyltransferase [Bacteroidales bacterium]|nr:N-acetyltransferase [Bacteroidales bacterium]